MIDINEIIQLFRIASRELFNNFFHVTVPYDNNGWLLEERFSEVQVLLFKKLVSEAAGLSDTAYGHVQNEILVEPISDECGSIMINRDVDSGYWDYPIKEFTKDVRLLFIGFFDWDQLGYRDNRYVRVLIDHWESHPEIIGKHALIETQYVQYRLKN